MARRAEGLPQSTDLTLNHLPDNALQVLSSVYQVQSQPQEPTPSRPHLLHQLRHAVAANLEHDWLLKDAHTASTPPLKLFSLVEHNGDILIFGGIKVPAAAVTRCSGSLSRNSSATELCAPQPQNSVFRLSKHSQLWEEVECSGELPSPRIAHSAVVHDGCMWVYGGRASEGTDPGNYLNDMFRLDLASFAWHRIPMQGHWPLPRGYHSAVVHRGNMWLYGGMFDVDERWHSFGAGQIKCYSFAEAAWHTLQTHGDLPTNYCTESIAFHGDTLFALVSSSKASHLQVKKLDPHTLRWSMVQTAGPAPRARFLPSATVIDDCWMVYGGFYLSTTFSDCTAFRFDSATWEAVQPRHSPLAPRPVSRSHHSAVALDGMLVLVGGEGAKSEGSRAVTEVTCLQKRYLVPDGAPPQPFANASLLPTMQALFRSTRLSDVAFVAGGQRIPAHRLVLASQSPVFEAMFEHPMLESRTGEVAVHDMSPAALDALLRYLYGRPQEVEDGALLAELLLAADKYGLPGLKAACADTLRGGLDATNAPWVALLADERDCPQLLRHCIAHVSAAPDPSDVFRGASFLSLQECCPAFAQSFMAAVSEQHAAAAAPVKAQPCPQADALLKGPLHASSPAVVM